MGHTNTTISAPISLHADVYPVLGVSKSGTYYDIGYINSNAHGKTNMWAKYKPVRYSNVAGSSANANWWKGDDGLCGLNIPSASGSPDSIYNKSWGYNAPRIGVDWCRLSDWDGYNHQCYFVVSGSLIDQTYTVNKNNPILRISCVIFNRTETNCLKLSDLSTVPNFRLAVKITASTTGGTQSWIITSNNKLSDAVSDSNSLQVAIDFSYFDYLGVGKFTLTQFFTTSSYPNITAFPSVITCYSVPNYLSQKHVNRIEVNYTSIAIGLDIIATGLSNSLWGTYNNEDYYMSNAFKVKNSSYEYWQISVENKADSSKTLNVQQLVWHGINVNGDDKTSSYADELRMYNSSRVETQSITFTAGQKLTIYFRTRIFSNGVSITSSMGAVTGVCYALYNVPSDNIENMTVARFEAHIQGSL